MSITDDIPTPWRIVDTGSAFRIDDARGRSLCWVYFGRNEAMNITHLPKDQAREMAKAIARLSLPKAE